MGAEQSNAGLTESWSLSLHAKSPRTVNLYLRTLGWFTDWLGEHERPAAAVGDLSAVTRQDAEAWFSDMRACGVSPPPRSGHGGSCYGTSTGWAHQEVSKSTSTP